MRRKITILVSVMLLVASMVTATLIADQNTHYNYSTTSTQPLTNVTNGPGYSTAYGHLYPGATSNPAKMQMWNAANSLIYAQDTYAAYPPNPDHISHLVYPGEMVRFKVKPVVTDQYIWGYGKCWC